jgi:hypothetical protein
VQPLPSLRQAARWRLPAVRQRFWRRVACLAQRRQRGRAWMLAVAVARCTSKTWVTFCLCARRRAGCTSATMTAGAERVVPVVAPQMPLLINFASAAPYESRTAAHTLLAQPVGWWTMRRENQPRLACVGLSQGGRRRPTYGSYGVPHLGPDVGASDE